MDKVEHGNLLRRAIAAQGLDRQTVADAVGVSVRSITNWTTGANMPPERARAALVRLLGDYAAAGDPVEAAVRGSELVQWRQNAVITEYQRHVYEQQREAAS